MATFHVSGAVDPRSGLPRHSCQCGCSPRQNAGGATRSKANAKPTQFNSFEKRLRRTILAERKNKNTETLAGLSSGRAPRQSAGDMRPAAGTTRLIPRPAPYASARDRKRAEAFAPESSLLAHLRLNGRDTGAAEEMLAENAARHVRAMRAPAAARPMSERDRKRAEAFIPPSSLEVWKAMQGKVPESDVIEDDKKATREALAHESEMKAILQGKKPATRSAPKSDRRR